jgi:hypothetical protein
MVNAIIRKNFRFTTSQKNLDLLLTLNVAIGLQKVNVVSYVFTNACKNNLKVTMLVGSPVPSDPINAVMTEQFIKNLNSLCISYKMIDVVAVYNINSGVLSITPGIIRRFFSLASCNDVKIYQDFSSVGSPIDDAEEVYNYVVNKPEKYVNLVNNFDISTADETLCININNVVSIVKKMNCHKKKC